VRQWGYRAKIDPVLVLDAKGGENKAKAINGSATTCENFENSRNRGFCLSKYSWLPLIVKSCSLVGKGLIMGKRGSFLILDHVLMKYLSLCFNKCVWLRDRKLSLIFKNKPSGGKEW
jgi:hypothetical protein